DDDPLPKPMRISGKGLRGFTEALAMIGKQARWLTAMALGMAFLASGTTRAGEFLGECGWCWRPVRDCPRREYSPLHYWAPELYRVRDCVHPTNLDQYPPGPACAVP